MQADDDMNDDRMKGAPGMDASAEVGTPGDDAGVKDMKIAIIAADTPEARAAEEELRQRYQVVPVQQADVVVALGGDGLMLHTMHELLGTNKRIFGMNRGSLGFLMNEYRADDLPRRIAWAVETEIHPLRMHVRDVQGQEHEALAFNEVSLFRQRHQAAKLRICVDGKVRMQELVCDGLIIATPAGSTAYNLSAHGPILPIDSPLLALTPISPFRPRRWRGAILPDTARVSVRVLEVEKRPVAAVADNREYRNVLEVDVVQDRSLAARLLFDPERSLTEKVIAEQFRYCD